jgi:hypothetical protein
MRKTFYPQRWIWNQNARDKRSLAIAVSSKRENAMVEIRVAIASRLVRNVLC